MGIKSLKRYYIIHHTQTHLSDQKFRVTEVSFDNAGTTSLKKEQNDLGPCMLLLIAKKGPPIWIRENRDTQLNLIAKPRICSLVHNCDWNYAQGFGSGSGLEKVIDPDPVCPERLDPDPVNTLFLITCLSVSMRVLFFSLSSPFPSASRAL